MPEPNPLVVSQEIEKDIKDTLYAIDAAPINLSDKLTTFRFYLSGIKSGYEITMKSATITLKLPLIDSIYAIYVDYDEGVIPRDIAWKQISELLI